ncbi:MAG: hypothetical protein JXQ93_04615 [Flavobacteriaceae bacterium]
MKNSRGIKIIQGVNKVVFFLTLGLFITIYLGFLAEIVLGIVQVLTSLLLIIFWKHFSKNVKEKLITYWVVTGMYLSLWLFDWSSVNESLIIIFGIGIVPMGIALYFLSILSEIRKESRLNLIEKIGIV